MAEIFSPLTVTLLRDLCKISNQFSDHHSYEKDHKYISLKGLIPIYARKKREKETWQKVPGIDIFR